MRLYWTDLQTLTDYFRENYPEGVTVEEFQEWIKDFMPDIIDILEGRC